MRPVTKYNDGGALGGFESDPNKPLFTGAGKRRRERRRNARRYQKREISREARERINENQDYGSGSLRSFLEDWADAAQDRSIYRQDQKEIRKQMRMSPEQLEAYYAEKSGMGDCKDGACGAYKSGPTEEEIASNLEAAADPDKAWRQQQKMDPNYNKLYNRLRRWAGSIEENKQRQADRAARREAFFDRREGISIGDPSQHRMIRNPFYNNINRMLARSADKRQYKLQQRHGVKGSSRPRNQRIKVSF